MWNSSLEPPRFTLFLFTNLFACKECREQRVIAAALNLELQPTVHFENVGDLKSPRPTLVEA